MKFRDMELEFDIFEETTAQKFGAAVKALSETEKGGKNESLPNSIRRQCQAVFQFFDQLFGDGFHKKLFGEKVSLTVCVDTYMDFMEEINQQRLAMESKVADMLAFGQETSEMLEAAAGPNPT